MHSDPSRLSERKSVDSASGGVASYPPAVAMDSSLQRAFSAILITPENWSVLFALPFLVAAKRLAARPRGWGAFLMFSSSWPSSMQDWENLYKKLEQWTRENAQMYRCHGHVICRENEVITLHDALYPNLEGQLADEAYYTARSLLCWHLAKDHDALERRRILSSISAGFDLLDRTDEARKHLLDLTNELAPLIDDYLPVSNFADLKDKKTLPAEAPSVPSAPFDELGCLLMAPFAELYGGERFHAEALSEVVRKLQIQPQGSEIRRFLEPPWARLLRRLLGPLADGTAMEAVDGSTPRYQGELVKRLARLPFEQRVQLLRELRQFILSLQSEQQDFPKLLPKQVDDYFVQLGLEIENERQCEPKIKAAEIDSSVPASVVPSDGASGLAGVQADRGRVPPVDRSPAHQPAAEDSRSRSVPPLRALEAQPFRTVTWHQVCKRISAIDNSNIERDLLLAQLLFSSNKGNSHVIVVGEEKIPHCLWFIGDLHGDPLALENAWDFISQKSAQERQLPHVVFLGDFVDRGPYSHETLLSLFRLILENPGRIGVVVGNHDENFQWHEDTKAFSSGIEPAEYTAELNRCLLMSDENSRFRAMVGRIAGSFFQRCPRAIFLPDGLLLAHGGFPHTDLLESLKSLADLDRNDCLQDFVWLRASANSRRKMPNRGSRGCDFGYEDFARFCEHMTKLGCPVRRLVRGHDHVPERYIQYPRYVTHPVLTINTMCRKLEDELISDQFPKACVARYVKEELPIVYSMPIDQGEIKQAFFSGRKMA